MLDCSRLKAPLCVIRTEPSPTAHKGSAVSHHYSLLCCTGSRGGKSALNSTLRCETSAARLKPIDSAFILTHGTEKEIKSFRSWLEEEKNNFKIKKS